MKTDADNQRRKCRRMNVVSKSTRFIQIFATVREAPPNDFEMFRPFLRNFWLKSPRYYTVNLQSVALSVPEIITIAVWGLGCEPPILGKRRPYWVEMVPFERAFVTSYRLSIVTFPLSLRVSEILPLLCSNTPLFHTPPLSSLSYCAQYDWLMLS